MTSVVRSGVRALAALAMTASLAAAGCSDGGGSGGGASPPPPPPPPPGPTWTSGVFQPASLFEDRCQVVRQGQDIEGNPFPDRPGSTIEELFWLRSWTHETYLWNTEVLDRDPHGYSDRVAYFDVLKTTATTASGKDKDQFHFSVPTTEHLLARNAAPRASYGAAFVVLAGLPPRDVRVLYTEANTPASEVVLGQVQLFRGVKILEVDGVDLVNANTQAAVDKLNAGLFPATANETHDFLVQDPGSNATRPVSLTSANIAPKAVNRTAVIGTPSGDVGYVLINTFATFDSEAEIAQAITAMDAAGVSDLVLDLRYNGGGLLLVASQLAYMVAGPVPTANADFERLQFNALAGTSNPVTGGFNQPTPFINTGIGYSLANGTPLDTLNLSQVYVLSTDQTCSASESVINGLRGVNVEVVLVGGVTCGKPYGFYPEDNCGETYFTIQFQGVNDVGFGDYADGFVPQNSSAPSGERVPGCAVADDLDHELGDQGEALLAAALQHRDGVPCPIATADAGPPDRLSAAGAGGLALSGESELEAFLRSSRDMRRPY